MAAVLRSAFALLIGLVTGMIVLSAIEKVGQIVCPVIVSSHEPGAATDLLAEGPVQGFLFILAAWGVGTLAGAALASNLAPRASTWHGLLIGALFLAVAFIYMQIVEHPFWFQIAGLCLFLPAAFIGAKCGGSNKVAPTAAV